jgi:hypothetical protein
VLDAAGCPPYTSGGVRVVSLARVRAALDSRDTTDNPTEDSVTDSE